MEAPIKSDDSVNVLACALVDSSGIVSQLFGKADCRPAHFHTHSQ